MVFRRAKVLSQMQAFFSMGPTQTRHGFHGFDAHLAESQGWSGVSAKRQSAYERMRCCIFPRTAALSIGELAVE